MTLSASDAMMLSLDQFLGLETLVPDTLEFVPTIKDLEGYDKQTHISSIAAAEKQGFTIEHSTDTTLLLDIDTLEKAQQYIEMLELVQKQGLFPGLVEEERWPSKTGNSHVRLRLGCAMEPYKRIALQALLGDDPKRVAHNLNRIDNGEDPATAIVLFRPSAEATAKLIAEDKNGILQ